MNTGLKLAAVLLACVSISTCTASTRTIHKDAGVVPATYDPVTAAASLDRSVGLLKRLALLPPALEVSPKNPRWCMDPCSPEGDRDELLSSAVAYLRQWRGYEVKRVDHACTDEPDGELCALARALAAWSRKAGLRHALPGDIADRLAAAGGELGVDGVMLLQGRFDYLKWTDVWHWTATLTASAYWDLAHGSVANVQVSIFSVTEPRRVWLSRTTLNQFGISPTFGRAGSYGESLLAPLEPALPDVFIRSRVTPPKE